MCTLDVHTCMRTYTLIHVRIPNLHTYISTYVYMPVAHTYMYTNQHTHAQYDIHTHIHQMHKYTYIHTYTRIHMHDSKTHIHTHQVLLELRSFNSHKRHSPNEWEAISIMSHSLCVCSQETTCPCAHGGAYTGV